MSPVHPFSRSPKVVVVVDDQGSVIGEAAGLVDRCRARFRSDAGRGDLIVDAPADVLFPRLAAGRPVRVLLRLLVESAKHVDEAQLVEDSGKPGTLFGKEAGILLVAAPVLEVDRLVGDVPVAAENDLAPSATELGEMWQEGLHEPELGRLAGGARGAGGQVDADDGGLAAIGFEVTAPPVELHGPEAPSTLCACI